MTGILVAALNHLLKPASWARARLQAYAARSVRFDVARFQLVMAIDSEGYFVPSDKPEPAIDVIIRLPSETPFLLLHGLDHAMAAAHVEGNAEFATELSFVLRNLHWDAEEDLSRLIGDVPAHRLVAGASHFMAWQKQAVGNLNANIAEYLAHENTLLLTWREFSPHRNSLEQLAARLARVEARCKAL